MEDACFANLRPSLSAHGMGSRASKTSLRNSKDPIQPFDPQIFSMVMMVCRTIDNMNIKLQRKQMDLESLVWNVTIKCSKTEKGWQVTPRIWHIHKLWIVLITEVITVQMEWEQAIKILPAKRLIWIYGCIFIWLFLWPPSCMRLFSLWESLAIFWFVWLWPNIRIWGIIFSIFFWRK